MSGWPRATGDGKTVVTAAWEAPMQTTWGEFWELENSLYSLVETDETYPLWPHPHLVGYVHPWIGGGSAPSPSTLWWASLLALSSLARYHRQPGSRRSTWINRIWGCLCAGCWTWRRIGYLLVCLTPFGIGIKRLSDELWSDTALGSFRP